MTAAQQAAKWARYRGDDLERLRRELEYMRWRAAEVRAEDARRAKWKAGG